MKTAVIIPAYNEGAVIAEVVRDVRKHTTAHVVVVDDCSCDETASVAKNAGAHVLSLCTNIGAWGAMQAGIRYACKLGYEQVVTMDGDGQHLAECLAVMETCEPEVDVVIGSCISRGSSARRMAWRYFRWLANLPIEDLTSGLRLYRKRALDVLIHRKATLLDYQDVGLLMLLRAEGMRFAEVNVAMRSRSNGKSRIFSSWWQVFSYMGSTTLICVSKMLQYDKNKRGAL